MGCASQGQRSEKLMQGCSGGEGSQESWRDHGRFRGDTRSGRGDLTSFQAFQVRRIVQDEADENQSHDVWILSTQVRGFQGLGGGTAQLSRVGPPQVQESRAQAKTRGRQTTGFSEISVVMAWRLPARERAVLANFLWRFQLLEACRVRQCLQGVGHPSVGLFLSTSLSFFGRSSIPFINFISGVSRPQVFAQSREKTRECRPDGSDVRHQTGCQAVPQEFQAAWEENDHGGFFAGPAGSCWIGPRSSSPGTGGGRPGGRRPSRCQPGSRQRLGHRWRPGNTPQATARPQVTVRIQVTAQPQGTGQWWPSGCLGRWVRATVWWTGRDGRPSTPSSRSTTWNPGSYLARGWTRRFQVYRDQQPAFPFHPEIHQSGNAGRLYVDVDVTTASDGPVQCSSCSSLSSGPVSSAGSQTWPNQQEISHAG